MNSRKCPICKGCMEYQQKATMLFMYCDLCRKTYHRVPGGNVIEIKPEDLDAYIEKNTKFYKTTIIKEN